MFCFALLYVHSSFASILMGKKELVALLCLLFGIVAFPDHAHYFLTDSDLTHRHSLWQNEVSMCSFARCIFDLTFACDLDLKHIMTFVLGVQKNRLIELPGCVAQSVTCLTTDASLTADPGVTSWIPARSHTFVWRLIMK